MAKHVPGNKRQRAGTAEANRKDDVNKLRVNQAFADQYEVKKRRELLNSAPAELLADDNEATSSSSEDEDEYGELLTKGIDRKVKETLEAIRSKDPRIYDPTTRFFDAQSAEKQTSGADSDDADDENVKSDDEPVAGWDTLAKSAEQSGPKITLKDYVRENLLKHGALSDSGEEDEYNDQRPDYEHERGEISRATNSARKKRSDDFSSSVAEKENVDQEDSENENEDDDFFTKKVKTTAEIEEEQKSLEKFIKADAKKRTEAAGEDLLLHSYLEKETPDEKDRFLRDFVINNGWLDRNANDAPSAKDYEIEIDIPVGDDDSEDADAFDEKVDNFEAKYNFRFEDPDGAKIALHSRHVPDSLRRPDQRRKLAREAKKQRKQKERAEKGEEIKQLKNAKKREIEARLLAIKEAAGDDVDIAGLDLDGDFDPSTFNKQMEERFGDDYYSRNDPQLEKFGEDTAVVSENRIISESFEEAPADLREDVNKMMDEYYNLDYEDIVAGKPMRFNYKRVDPESFNLSTEQILEMDEKELNRLVSVKYLAPYRARRDVSKQAWWVRTELEKQRMNNHYQNTDSFGNGAFETDYGASDSKSQSVRKKKRLRASKKDKSAIVENEISAVDKGDGWTGEESNQEKASFDADAGVSGTNDVATGAGDTVAELDGAPAKRNKRSRGKKQKGMQSASENIAAGATNGLDEPSAKASTKRKKGSRKQEAGTSS